MNKERLLKLADFLDTVDKKQFNMGSWLVGASEIEHGVEQSLHDLVEHKCGSQACALGWACAIPEFKEAGLHISSMWAPVFAGEIGSDAGALFFNISSVDADKLFSGVDHFLMPTPTQKANQIRGLVETGRCPAIRWETT